MPDFDIDFCEEKRDKVFEYLKRNIKKALPTLLHLENLARMALRDVGRVWTILRSCR